MLQNSKHFVVNVAHLFKGMCVDENCAFMILFDANLLRGRVVSFRAKKSPNMAVIKVNDCIFVVSLRQVV